MRKHPCSCLRPLLSTLLLLVSAFLGGNWRQVYDFALANDFRFLSYGDACLFL